MVKVGGGLSCPILFQRGIRQGCPISGNLTNALFFKSEAYWFLCARSNEESHNSPVWVGTDDVIVFITGSEDIKVL
jgi:hypothetical protein